jgi:hypothetical protein
MHEHGKVVILGKSIESYEAKEVPWKPTGWLHKRMSIKDLEAVVEAITPTTAKVMLALHLTSSSDIFPVIQLACFACAL